MATRVEGRPLTDAELIEAARRGDVAAYEELVRRYEQLAFRTAYRVCGDPDEARDAAQEGLVRAYGSLRGFRTGAEHKIQNARRYSGSFEDLGDANCGRWCD